jgi:hypothetical protein
MIIFRMISKNNKRSSTWKDKDAMMIIISDYDNNDYHEEDDLSREWVKLL